MCLACLLTWLQVRLIASRKKERPSHIGTDSTDAWFLGEFLCTDVGVMMFVLSSPPNSFETMMSNMSMDLARTGSPISQILAIV